MSTDRPRIPGWPGPATAREFAAAAGARTVGTRHLLLALVRRDDLRAHRSTCTRDLVH